MKNHFRSVMFFSVLASFSAEAYMVASLPGAAPFSRTTHVLVAGRGKEMGRQFAQSAVGQAYRLRELNRENNIVIITVREKGDASDVAFFQNLGFRVERNDATLLSGAELVEEVKRQGKIASLEFFSHAGFEVGPGLEGGDYRFNLGTPNIRDLAGRFTSDAYVIFWGCNSGYKVAPGVSRLWGVPAAGSLGATDFEQLHKTGIWYGHNDGQYPEGGYPWAGSNNVSYFSPVRCGDHPYNPCYRMKPDNVPYKGLWGKFLTGLGFYKWFCANGADGACLRGVRKAIISSVGSIAGRNDMDFEGYKQLARDWVCPSASNGQARRACVEGIDRALATRNRAFTVFSGTPLSCDLRTGCEFKYQCPTAGELCGMVSTSARASTALVDDYELILKAGRPGFRWPWERDEGPEPIAPINPAPAPAPTPTRAPGGGLPPWWSDNA
jgi:hypothetical protein